MESPGDGVDGNCDSCWRRRNPKQIFQIRVLSGDDDIENVEEWLEKQQIREEDEVTVCELFDQ